MLKAVRVTLTAALAMVSASAAAASRDYVVSCVAKGDDSPFLNRLATATHNVIVTYQSVAGAVESVTVHTREGEAWFLIEPRAPIAKYPGEIGRVCGLIIAHAFAPLAAHSHDRAGNFIEPFGTELFQPKFHAPLRFVAARSNDASPTVAIDPDYLKQKLEELSGVRPVIVNGTSQTITERGSAAGRKLARDFLKQEYEALGFTVSSQVYGNGGNNFIAERSGRDPSKAVLVTSHLDSVNNAGADDNGAGTISALAIARALKDLDLGVSLRIVAFDQEELGLLGSKAYAAALNTSGEIRKVAGVFNLEMTAYDSDHDGHLHIIDCNENTSATLTAQVLAAVTRERVALTRVEACTNRSDHAAFWRYNVPAIVISENFFGGDGNPCYHRACDKTDILDFDYMRKITQAMAGAVAAATTGQFID